MWLVARTTVEKQLKDLDLTETWRDEAIQSISAASTKEYQDERAGKKQAVHDLCDAQDSRRLDRPDRCSRWWL